MFKFAIALLCAGQAAAYTFDETKSVNSVHKMRSLSASLYATHTNSAQSNGAAEEIVQSIEDMQAIINDIPGAGFIISHIWPGNDDTK